MSHGTSYIPLSHYNHCLIFDISPPISQYIYIYLYISPLDFFLNIYSIYCFLYDALVVAGLDSKEPNYGDVHGISSTLRRIDDAVNAWVFAFHCLLEIVFDLFQGGERHIWADYGSLRQVRTSFPIFFQLLLVSQFFIVAVTVSINHGSLWCSLVILYSVFFVKKEEIGMRYSNFDNPFRSCWPLFFLFYLFMFSSSCGHCFRIHNSSYQIVHLFFK